MVDVRTLVVPSGDVVAETLNELEAALTTGGAKGTQRDLGPGGANLYPCMGLAGVYVTEAPAAEVKLNTDKYVIEEGWPGSRSFHGHSLDAAHHETVTAHVFTPDEMDDVNTATKAKALGQIFNFGAGKKLAEIAPSEYDMLVDNLGNDPMDSISIAGDTGLLWLFTKPTHILETLAGILDPMTAGAIANPGSVWYSKDTTDGTDGTWRPLHGHIQDFNAVPGLLLDSPLPATVKPLMTNVEGVKALILLGPGGRPPGAAAEPPEEAIDPFAAFAGGGGTASESLCEWRIWIPKAATHATRTAVSLSVGAPPAASVGIPGDLWVNVATGQLLYHDATSWVTTRTYLGDVTPGITIKFMATAPANKAMTPAGNAEHDIALVPTGHGYKAYGWSVHAGWFDSRDPATAIPAGVPMYPPGSPEWA